MRGRWKRRRRRLGEKHGKKKSQGKVFFVALLGDFIFILGIECVWLFGSKSSVWSLSKNTRLFYCIRCSSVIFQESPLIQRKSVHLRTRNEIILHTNLKKERAFSIPPSLLGLVVTREIYVTLEHKSSHKQHRYICRNSQQYIVWVKITHFYFMPEIIRILRTCSMKIFCKFPTINISKRHFWSVICIAKNFIWTTLKAIFSIFRFFCTLRFQIYKYCPIITNL